MLFMFQAFRPVFNYQYYCYLCCRPFGQGDVPVPAVPATQIADVGASSDPGGAAGGSATGGSDSAGADHGAGASGGGLRLTDEPMHQTCVTSEIIAPPFALGQLGQTTSRIQIL